jgi:hypothetical protein
MRFTITLKQKARTFERATEDVMSEEVPNSPQFGHGSAFLRQGMVKRSMSGHMPMQFTHNPRKNN